jgi:molybdopterin-guanine dinucleotide biosynthesis protein A
MGGKDKGLIEINKKPAVLRALKLIRPFCDHRFISANRNQEAYAKLGAAEVITDLREGYQGPLAGIEALSLALGPLHSCRRVLLLPCDLPRLSAKVPELLLAELDARPEVDIVYASTGSQHHYLCAAIRKPALATLSQHLDQGVRAVRDWYALSSSQALVFGDELTDSFVNMNTPHIDPV